MAAVLARLSPNEDICFVCCDDYQPILEAIRAGQIYTAIVQQPSEMGRRAVELLTDCLENGAADIPNAVYIPTFEIDAGGIGAYAWEADGPTSMTDTGGTEP